MRNIVFDDHRVGEVGSIETHMFVLVPQGEVYGALSWDSLIAHSTAQVCLFNLLLFQG